MKFCLRSTVPMNIEDKKYVLNKIKRMVDIKKPKIYNFSRYNMNDLEKSHYLMTFKTSGSKFYLFLTTFNGFKYSLFIQYDNPMQLKIYNVKLRFDNELYNDTIIDGELLLNEKQNWIYMCNNILYLKGKYIGNKYLGFRIQVLSDILRNKYKYDDFLNNCHLQLRSYFLFNHLEMLTHTHNNELLLIPEIPNKPILSFQITNLTKNERLISLLSKNENNEKTKQFFVYKTEIPDVFELYIKNYLELVKNIEDIDKLKEKYFQGIACISTKSQSFYMKKLFDETDEKGIWIDFIYNDLLKGWEPKI